MQPATFAARPGSCASVCNSRSSTSPCGARALVALRCPRTMRSRLGASFAIVTRPCASAVAQAVRCDRRTVRTLGLELAGQHMEQRVCVQLDRGRSESSQPSASGEHAPPASTTRVSAVGGRAGPVKQLHRDGSARGPDAGTTPHSNGIDVMISAVIGLPSQIPTGCDYTLFASRAGMHVLVSGECHYPRFPRLVASRGRNPG